MTDTILFNGRISPGLGLAERSALAIKDGVVTALGDDASVQALANASTRTIDLKKRRVIPGLNDSHIHLIRGGLNFNLELRWENVPSLADALTLLREQALRTPPPQWVRVIGGWSEFQFAERRMPTLEEINAAAPDTPVFILHLYGRALLNKAALNALGFTADTPNPPGGVVEKDHAGRPTGLLLAKPSALILYSTLARGPGLSLPDKVNSTRQFMRELNRLGVTSIIDAGGGWQNYPDDYVVIEQLHRDKQLSVRIAYNLFAQKAGSELNDYERWTNMTTPGAGDAMYRMNGAGENLAWSAADFENFLEPRPDLAPAMESELEKIVELLATKAWPFRIHATYDESIDRFLTVFERVNGREPFRTRFIIDHAETISHRNIERIAALGGGIAVQHRMAFQGEYFQRRYGAAATAHTPPLRQMLANGLPVGAGTDATRVASYDPWVALYWLSTGKTVGGQQLYGEDNVLSRAEALHLWTRGSAWFSGESDRKGTLQVGAYADLAVLSADYFTMEDAAIRQIHSMLTMVDGNVVHASDSFSNLNPPMPPASPDWSPVIHAGTPAGRHGVYGTSRDQHHAAHHGQQCHLHSHGRAINWHKPLPVADLQTFWGALGCSCFVF